MKHFATHIAFNSVLPITLLYCFFAGLWTFFSKRLIDTISSDIGQRALWQTSSDWLFVAVTAVVLYALLSARRRAGVELRQSDERLRGTLDSMLEGYQIIGWDWRYLYVNPAVVAQGKQTKEQLLGHTMMEMYPGIENTELFGVLKRCKEEHTSNRIENEFLFPDGSKGWFELFIEPVPEGIFILSMDITKRKLAEDRIEQQLGHLMALREIDRAIISSFDQRFSLDTVLAHAITQLRVDAADVLLLNPSSQVLEYASGRGFQTHAFEQVQLRLEASYAGRAVLDRSMVHVSKAETMSKAFGQGRLLASEGFVSYYGVPLIVKGIVKGVLEVFHRSAFEPDQEWLNFLEALAGQAAIAVDNAALFADLQRSNYELSIAYDRTIEGWSRALDLRDKETEGHTQRVTETSLQLARAFGLSEDELVYVRWGGLLHDIGKMGVPDHILLKPDALTEEEWVMMKKHPQFAYEMLLPISYLKSSVDIPYCHHEKWDGTGYPRGLKGEQIPFSARIFAVVDVWDALTSDRPYRPAWSREKAIQYIQEEAGKYFDTQVVEKFVEIMVPTNS
jgi:PAS domain S-box-containing protein/putative nucleotidyltransferase with HDIG domain